MSGCFDSEKKSITSLSCLEDRFDVHVKWATHYANKLDESIRRLEQYCSDQDRIRKTEIEDCESDIVCIKGKLEKLEEGKVNLIRYECLQEILQRLDKLETSTKYNHINLVDACRRVEICEINIKNEDDYSCEARRFIEGLDERIEKLEKNIVDYSDIQEIHRVLNEHYHSIWNRDPQKLKERIERLEQHKNYQIDENRKISRRFDELSDTINNLLCNNNKDKPHKCPVCDGNKVRIYLNTDVDGDNYRSQIQKNPCHSCDGKGIVWK